MTTFTQVTPDLKTFSGLVIDFGPKGRHGRMCNSVHYKLGRTIVSICQNLSTHAPKLFACVLFFLYFSKRNKVHQARTLHTCSKMFFTLNCANVLASVRCAKMRRNSHFGNITAYIFQIWSSHLCIHAKIQT